MPVRSPRHPDPRRAAALLAFVAVLALNPRLAAAQTVKGVVVTQGSGEPVPGALAVLLDSAGRRLAAGLAGADGRFELRALAPGRYRLAAERIGYATSTTPFFVLAAGATVERTLVASVQAVSLEAIHVTAASRCRRARDAPADVQRLWNEARKALTSVSLVEDAPDVSFRSVLWDRDLDPEWGTVRKEARRQVWAMGDYPFRSPPARRLLAGGFVQGSLADTVTYYAPDAHVLLSDAFLSDYCFRAVSGHDGLIGLAFEPVPGGSDLPAVKGTLWLDAASAALRRLDYGYVQLPFRARRHEPGGELDLRRLPDGAFIVSSWSIRMPRFGWLNGVLTDSVVYMHETGGRVVEVRGLGGVQELAAPTGTLRGKVLAGGDAPLSDVMVYLSGTSYADTTDDNGDFAIPDVWTGRYELAWYDGKRDPAAQHVVPRSVEVREGENVVAIHVAGMDDFLAAGCPLEERRAGVGVILGVVREKGTGVPLGGVQVKLTGVRGREEERTTDRAGRFRFCWQPTDTYTLEAGLKDFGSTRTGVRLGSLKIVRRELELEVAARPAAGHGALPPRLSGRVLDAGTGEPLADVMVKVRGTKWTRVSDDSGRFVFPEVPAGDVVLDASRPGYADATGSVSAARGQSLRLEIRMATRPFELEPVVVTAVQTRRAGALADLEYRVRRGWGTYIQRQDIEKVHPRYVSDVLPITAFQVMGGLILNRRTGCPPAIYLDGVRMQESGQSSRTTDPKVNNPVNLVNPASIETIEVYKGPATTPAEFGGSTAECGVIAIWTRRGPPEPDTSRTGGQAW